MAAEEKDVELGLSNDGSTADSSSQNEKVEGEAGFEPVKTEASKPASARPSNTISRTRSNNGFGVDDLEVDNVEVCNEANVSVPAKDPYEVSWEGGDADPMNPRSMGIAKKWALVVATCAGALCV